MEIWKTIENYPYAISNHGRIKRLSYDNNRAWSHIEYE